MSAIEHVPTHWIGAAPSALEKAALIFVGTVAILIAGIQPNVLGGLHEAGRLTINEIGVAGSVELFAIGVSILLAAAFLPPRRVRVVGIISSAVMITANVANLNATGFDVILCRLVAGSAEGVMMWLPISMITRADKPERWSAIFLVVQTISQFAVSMWASLGIAPKYGVNGSIVLMASLGALAAAASLLVPKQFTELPKQADVSVFNLGVRAYAGLFSIFMYLAFIIGVWVYVESIGMQAGLDHHTASLAVSVSLIAQVMGGLAMTALGRRLPYYQAILICCVVNLGLLAVLGLAPGASLFFIVVAVHGFFWLFVMPYQVLLLIDIDPTRRAALFLSATQLLGASSGPYLASLFVSDQDVRGALGVGAACIVISMVTMMVLHAGKEATPIVA